MSDIAKTVTVVEVTHASEMQEDLRRRLRELQKQDSPRMDSVRANILAAVVGEAYERAKSELSAYVERKSEFPAFQERVERHVRHCAELIEAIETKRNFPGLASLSMAKQQELHERVLRHFEELKHNLKHIEKIERDHQLTDVRSTVWVLKALCYVVAGIVLTLFVRDLHSGLLSSTIEVSGGYLDEASSWLVSKLPF